MSSSTTRPTIPRAALIGAAAMVALSLVTAAVGRIGGPVEVVQADIVQSRSLRFEDLQGGLILVTDAETGAVVEEFAAGAGGFVRGSMRGLARERKRRGMGSEIPFILDRHADGRLTLTDPVTERVIDLAAFGSTNSAVFAGLLSTASTEGAIR